MILSILTRDFRLLDNRMLYDDDNIIPVFLLDDFNQKEHGENLKSIFFRYVYEFDRKLRAYGKRLHVVYYRDVNKLIDRVKPRKVLYSLDPEPRNRERFEMIKELCRDIPVIPIWQFPTSPTSWNFRSFTHFYRTSFNRNAQPYLYEIDRMIDRLESIDAEFLIDLEEIYKKNAKADIEERYYKDELKIVKDLERFVASVDYSRLRDYPGIEGTSKISVYLRVGAISHVTAMNITKNSERFVSEIAWSDFYRILLWNFPEIVNQEWNPKWRRVEWNRDMEIFELWKRGETGIDMVDAGMKQLNREGWMHNRVRMITASFLTKNLRIDWRLGERYFYSKLVDADLAQNVGNWQWVAGSGTDTVYFRVFNPNIQQEKYDRDKLYISRYLSGSRPKPIVDIDRSREEYLEWIKNQLG